MMSVIEFLGPWSWVIFGLVLLGLEIMAPGTFFLWFGISAIVVGAVTLVVGTDNAVWVWQLQWIVFLVLTLGTAIVGRRIMVNKGWDGSDNPNLNERGQQMVGRTAILSDAISEGRGRAKIGDTVWQVSGPDLAQGSRVRVTGHDGGVLMVEAAE